MKKTPCTALLLLCSIDLFAQSPDPSTGAVVFSLIPVVMFLLMIAGIVHGLRKAGYSIGDALKTDDAKPTASASRLIAFITAFTAIILAVCLSSFWLYNSYSNQTANVSKLTPVFVLLGIGVAPYCINKIISTLKK